VGKGGLKMQEIRNAGKQEGRRELLVREALKRATAIVVADFIDKGLLGEHELQVLPPVSTQTKGEIVGKISGSLFGFRGYLEGGVGSQPSVRFAWVTNNKEGELILTEFPADKFVIERREEEGQPTVEFALNTPKFMEPQKVEESEIGFELIPISYPHPNDYLKGDRIRVARIRVSGVDFDSLQRLSSNLLPSE
jgi:hypothetical protein